MPCLGSLSGDEILDSWLDTGWLVGWLVGWLLGDVFSRLQRDYDMIII